MKKCDEDIGELVEQIIKEEIDSYSKCMTYRTIANHYQYICGMIRLAARCQLLDSPTCIILNKNNEFTKLHILDKRGLKYEPSETK